MRRSAATRAHRARRARLPETGSAEELPCAGAPADAATTRRPQGLRSRPKAGFKRSEKPDRAASRKASRSDAAIAPQLPPKGGPPRARPPRELQKVQQPGRLLTRRPQPPHQPRADLNACDRVRRQVRAKREPDRAASPWASRSDAAIARIAR